MNPSEWLSKVGKGSTLNAVATKAGVQPSTLMRQVDRGSLSAEVAITVARAHDYSPVQALVETGHLRVDEVDGQIHIVELGDVSDHDLLAEMLRRIDTGKDLAELWMRPLDDEFVQEIAEGAGKPRLRVVSDEEIREAANGDVAAKTDLTWELETDQ